MSSFILRAAVHAQHRAACLSNSIVATRLFTTRQPASIQHNDAKEETPRSMYDRGLRPDESMLQQVLARGIRPYFYYIDLNGHIFLQDTIRKDSTSCYKDVKFLNFFVHRLRPNTTTLFPEYAWQSPCGKEINFVEAADTPIVFHDLQDGQLLWAGTFKTPFLPDQVRVSYSTGRFYHPLPSPLHMKTEVEVLSTPHRQIQMYRGSTFGLLRSSLVQNELADDIDEKSFAWKGTRFAFKHVP
ncbi:hypothetical protein EDD11_005289 [Mortierella claussenii]|nr:hypothetical protein EDD11_005289 [Mortierella claussenii]